MKDPGTGVWAATIWRGTDRTLTLFLQSLTANPRRTYNIRAFPRHLFPNVKYDGEFFTKLTILAIERFQQLIRIKGLSYE
jgi:hypothetical protein